VKVLGIEPTANTAEAARKLGIPVEVRFFGRETAKDLRSKGFAADLMPANNVVAHVPTSTTSWPVSRSCSSRRASPRSSFIM
jgi:hypothetical protein